MINNFILITIHDIISSTIYIFLFLKMFQYLTPYVDIFTISKKAPHGLFFRPILTFAVIFSVKYPSICNHVA